METKATWEDWATRLVSAATIAALGYFVEPGVFGGYVVVKKNSYRSHG